MSPLTRIKAFIAILAVVIGFIAVGVHQGHAATGGTVVQFSADPALTSTSTGVTSSQAFPDGNTTAQCFIQVTSNSGAQSTTSGNCAGISLTVTCASSQFTGTPPGKGAGLTVNGTATWTGAYDNGTTCTTGTKIAGASPTLTADLAGVAAGQNVVFFLNTDAGTGFNSPNGRNGCWRYTDSGGTSAEQCMTVNSTNGPGGTFYEATTAAATGTIQQDQGAQRNNNGNMTLGGVFIEAAGQQAAPTATPGTPTVAPTATPVPTATTVPVVSAPTIPAAVRQFSSDPGLTSAPSGVTSSQVFPDGGSLATCFVKITTKSGPQSQNAGNCTGITVTVTCSSSQFSSTPTGDQDGAGVVIGGARQLSGAYDTGPSCTTVPKATLTYDVSGITPGTRLVFFWNNDTSPSRDGCVSYQDSTGHSTQACVQNTASGTNGTYYEVIAGATSGTAFQVQGAQTVGKSGNLTAGGVFIGGPIGTALAAHPVTVHRAHGLNHLRWYSEAVVRGFNVYSGKLRLNHHLVTSATRWYHFTTRHALSHLRLVSVK